MGKWALAKDKANLFAEPLKKTFPPLDRQTSCGYIADMPRILEYYDIRPVTLKELKAKINNTNAKKAPGYDLITGQIFKA